MQNIPKRKIQAEYPINIIKRRSVAILIRVTEGTIPRLSHTRQSRRRGYPYWLTIPARASDVTDRVESIL